MDSNLEGDVGHHTGSMNDSSLPLSFVFLFFFISVMLSFLNCVSLYVQTLALYRFCIICLCLWPFSLLCHIHVICALLFWCRTFHEEKKPLIYHCTSAQLKGFFNTTTLSYLLSLSVCRVFLHRYGSWARVESCHFPSSFSPRCESFTHFLNRGETRHPIAVRAGQWVILFQRRLELEPLILRISESGELQIPYHLH